MEAQFAYSWMSSTFFSISQLYYSVNDNFLLVEDIIALHVNWSLEFHNIR